MQRIALVAANLTARWARRVHVVMAVDATLVPPLARDGADTLGSRVLNEMQSVRSVPETFSVTKVRATGEPAPLVRLFVGPWSHAPQEIAPGRLSKCTRCGGRRSETTWADRSGANRAHACRTRRPQLEQGLAGGARSGRPPSSGPSAIHPISGCRTFAWDLWANGTRVGADRVRERVTPHAVPSSLTLGKLLVAGVGAIGSAFIYLADTMPMDGELTVFDRDCVDTTNLNRSPLFTVRHASSTQLKKTAAVADYLLKRGVMVTARTGKWQNQRNRTLKAAQPFDAWISLTNEDGACGRTSISASRLLCSMVRRQAAGGFLLAGISQGVKTARSAECPDRSARVSRTLRGKRRDSTERSHHRTYSSFAAFSLDSGSRAIAFRVRAAGRRPVFGVVSK